MAEKNKNSLLNIHYSRTLTPDNLSRAANYAGEYVLKGLGAFGKFLNTGFTSPTYGTIGQVSYARNAQDAKRLRKLSEASEQALGKAMTWISPLNYGAALATGNGLNARKGEEEVASWSPAWQAAARLGELYVGPKGVKAAKAALKTVVNAATKAGNKAAKKAVITREIKLATKNKPNIEVPNLKFTTAKSVYNEGNMSGLEILNASGQGLRDAYKAYLPGGVWYERLIANGIPRTEVDALANEYLRSLLNTNLTIETSSLSDAVAVTGGKIIDGKYFPEIKIDPRYTKNSELVRDATTHEAGHVSTLNLEPNNSSFRESKNNGFYQLVEKDHPEIKKAMEYDETLRPEIKESALDEILEKGEQAELHFNNVAPLQELRQRAFASEIDASNKGVSIEEYINNPKLWSLNFKQLAEIFDKEGLKNYMKYYKSITPIVGGYTLYNLLNNLNILKLEYRKQGGKINVIEQFRKGGQIRKMLTAAGGSLQLTPEELKYLKWSKITPLLKREYRNNRINAELQRGPNIKHFWEAFQTYIGNRDPENPNLNIGIVNATPGRATPQLILLSAKLMETINKYWKSLGKLKVRLSGGRATSGILTKPGTAPTTFNGLNINYITSPKGGNVTHKFYTDLGSEYILTKDGFARRVKSPHNNTLGQGSGPTEWNATNSDAGLHNWNEGTTIFTEGEDGKLFNTAFYKLSDFGFKPGTYGLVRKGEKARIMLIDPKTKLWRAAMLSDVYPTTVKLGLQADRVMETNYSDVPKLGWHILEKANGGWHPGSPVAFIEGLKQGGKMNILEFLKKGSGIHIKKENRGKFTDYCRGKVTDECIRKAKASGNPTLVKRATFADNARHFKHRSGGLIVQKFKLRKMLNNIINN